MAGKGKATTKRIIDAAGLRIELMKQYEQGVTSLRDLWELFGSLYSIGKYRLNNTHKEAYADWCQMREHKLAKVGLNNLEKELKSGVKSKIERVLEIQKMLDDDQYEETIYDFKTGQQVVFNRQMTPSERRGLYDLLAKMQGDYVPTTSNVNVMKFGKDREQYDD
jgi:hypothetical protein